MYGCLRGDAEGLHGAVGETRSKLNSTVKQVLIWVLAVAFLLVSWQFVSKNMNTTRETTIPVSQLQTDAEAGKISEVTINGTAANGIAKDGSHFNTTVPPMYPDLYKDLISHGVKVSQKDPNGNQWLGWLLQLAPIAIILALFLFMMRQMQSGGNKALSFGKNRARLLSMQQKKITFKDVAGVDEAKEELKEIIEFLREAQKFQRLGGRIPKGVLMVGPPGTGKTLLARAVAGEANVPFFSISGSDFVEMFVGVGAQPRARPLRAGQEECAVHYLHR